jgi:hypothetical protein
MKKIAYVGIDYHQNTLTIAVRIQGKKMRFFSNLVVESLIDFQRKVAQIMKPICFTLNDFNLIVYALQLSSMDGIFTMI